MAAKRREAEISEADIGVDWKAYALGLEGALRESMAQVAGWRALSDAITSELIGVAPQSALVSEESRRRIFIDAQNAYANGVRAE